MPRTKARILFDMNLTTTIRVKKKRLKTYKASDALRRIKKNKTQKTSHNVLMVESRFEGMQAGLAQKSLSPHYIRLSLPGTPRLVLHS